MKKKAEELIRNLVPELQELKDGQELASKLKYGYGAVITNVVGDKQGTIVVKTRLDGGLLVLNESVILNEYNVVGFNIHLEHVMKAMELSDYVIDVYGNIQEMVQTGGYSEYQSLETVARYDLSKPFTEQSEEFYKFIVDILK